jgi:hypothetical protein
MFKTYALSILCLLVIAQSANAALPNADRYVGKIDVMKSYTVIWIWGDMMDQPEACNLHKAVSCPNEKEYCKLMVSVALSAKLANKKVEFAFSDLCNGSFADVDRFRMMNE